MKIKVTSVYVDDQDKALRFYTEILGFAKKADFSQGRFRWLTVASPEEPDGTELQLALNDNPAAKAYQQAIFQQGQPAAMFWSSTYTLVTLIFISFLLCHVRGLGRVVFSLVFLFVGVAFVGLDLSIRSRWRSREIGIEHV